MLLSATYSYKTQFSNTAWGKYEENISSCYLTDAGFVTLDSGVLQVLPNYYGSKASNHIIAQRRLSRSGFTSDAAVYKLDFYIDANPADWLTHPEDGPELSVQNTRYVSSQYQTATAGFQAAMNPWGSPHWKVWTQTAPLSGAWFDTAGAAPALRTWYTFEAVIDYSTNTYVSAKYCYLDGGSCQFLGVDGGSVGVNVKWGEEGLWITAEGENIWQASCASDAGLVLKTVMLYDNASLTY